MSSIYRVDSRANWTSTNPILLPGEVGLEMPARNIKIGNGRSTWQQLNYCGNPGYCGSFYDLTSQTAVANTPTAIYLRSTDAVSNGVLVTQETRMTFNYGGVYSIVYSVQFSSTNASIHDTNVWLSKNGTNVPASDSRFSVTERHGSVDGNLIGAVNYVVSVDAGDYFELIWATSHADVYIHAEAAQTSPFAHPSIPGIICTAVQVASN